MSWKIGGPSGTQASQSPWSTDSVVFADGFKLLVTAWKCTVDDRWPLESKGTGVLAVTVGGLAESNAGGASPVIEP